MTINMAMGQMLALAKRGYGVPFGTMWSLYVEAVRQAGPQYPFPQWRAINRAELQARGALQQLSDREFLR